MALATIKFAEHADLHMTLKTCLFGNYMPLETLLSGHYMPPKKNYVNFERSGAPQRVMRYSHGEWEDLEPEVVERLRQAFLEKRPIVEVPLEGLDHGLFDFLGMVRLDIATGEKCSIAWIDENDQCFFPDNIAGQEITGSLPMSGNIYPGQLQKAIDLLHQPVGVTTLEAEGNPKPLYARDIRKPLQHLPISKLKDPRSGDHEQLSNFIATLSLGAIVKKYGPVRLGKSSRGPLNACICVLNPKKPVELCSLASESNLSHASGGPGLGGNGDVRIDMPSEPSSGGSHGHPPPATLGGSHGHPPPATLGLHLHNGNELHTRTSGDGDGDHRSFLEVADSQLINARAINEDVGSWIAILCAVVTIISIDGNSLLPNGKALRIVAGLLNIIGFFLNLLLLECGRPREDCLPEDIKKIMKWTRQVVVSFAFVGASCLVFPDKYIWLAAGCFWLITAVLLFSKPLAG